MEPKDYESRFIDQGSGRPAPDTPDALLRIQQGEERELLHGLDLSAKSRAVYSYAEELELSIMDYIDMSYAMLRQAELALEFYLSEESETRTCGGNTSRITHKAVWVGGLRSLRMGLRSMVESPMEPDMWMPCVISGQPQCEEIPMAKTPLIERCLEDLTRLRTKKLITNGEHEALRIKHLSSHTDNPGLYHECA
jgi:hypothetical protein